MGAGDDGREGASGAGVVAAEDVSRSGSRSEGGIEPFGLDSICEVLMQPLMQKNIVAELAH